VSAKKLNKAVLLIESQPPHLGELMQLLSNFHKYNLIYLCITGAPKVMSHDQVLQVWNFILKPYIKKVQLMIFTHNIIELSKDELPEILDDCTYLTSDRATFVHLSTLGCNSDIIPRALGYNTTFLRTAFRQSKALDWLEARYMNSITNIKNER